MIGTLLTISWLNLRRDYVALGLTLVLPIVFFSIFALIFGGMSQPGPGAGSAIDILVVDRDQTDLSKQLIALMGRPGAVTIHRAAPASHTREAVRDMIRTGQHTVAVIFPAGFSHTHTHAHSTARDQGQARPPLVEIIYDAADPITHNIVTGLLEAAAVRAISGAGPVRVVATPARAEGADGSIIAYYAAGISVMFLLFSMAAAGGALLDEEESGTLERVLMSNVTMTGLLAAKWLFFSILGVVQVTLMFLWAALVFDLDLFSPIRLLGFLAMTLATAVAASAFGVCLATLCRTRAQLTGLSIILILLMSALGGSMVPRFAMPAFMHTTSLFTFNGWALDGYLKVFWYDDPNASLGRGLLDVLPQLIVLIAMAGTFLTIARILARRWEAEACGHHDTLFKPRGRRYTPWPTST